MKSMLVHMNPKDIEFVGQESILKATTRCEELCGFVGSPWMIYVHPEEDVMVLHNTASGKMVSSHIISSDF